jgi:hypothetical protein
VFAFDALFVDQGDVDGGDFGFGASERFGEAVDLLRGVGVGSRRSWLV